MGRAGHAPKGANLWFETAWDPPLGWVEKVSALFPDAEFLLGYTEGGRGFWGTALFSAGQLRQKEHHTVGFWVEDAEEPTVSAVTQVHMGLFGLGTGG